MFVVTRERGVRLPGDNATGPGSLRLRLERSRREVGTRAELEAESEEDGDESARSRTAAMLALFAGRPPKRAWPTIDLFGGEAVERPGGAEAGSQVRFRGALRGVHDYAADEDRGVVQHVRLPAREPPSPSWPGSDFPERERYSSHVDGFHLVAVRTVSHRPSETSVSPLIPSPATKFTAMGSATRKGTIGEGRPRGVGCLLSMYSVLLSAVWLVLNRARLLTNPSIPTGVSFQQHLAS